MPDRAPCLSTGGYLTFRGPFGLKEDYLDRTTATWTNLQKFARATGTLVEKLATLNRAQSRVAYLWMHEKPDTREEQALLDNLPSSHPNRYPTTCWR